MPGHDCPRCEELSAKLAVSIPKETMGSIMLTLQAAQERLANMVQTERQANLYTEEEAQAIMTAFCGFPPVALDARKSILAALEVQQPGVYAGYVDFLKEPAP